MNGQNVTPEKLQKDGVEIGIVNSLVSEGLESITDGVLEASLDTFLREGFLRDIPVVGAILGLAKTGIGISQIIFTKKICHFLSSLSSIQFSKRKEFIDKISADEKVKRKVGETVIAIIDKCDEIDKARVIGNLMGALVADEITYEDFIRLCSIANRAFFVDLFMLRELNTPQCSDDVGVHNLYALGLLSNVGYDGGEWGSGKPAGIIYGMNTYGEMMLRHGINGLSANSKVLLGKDEV